MGKPIGRTVRGIGNFVGSLFGAGDTPQAPPVPAPPPQIPMPVVRPDAVTSAQRSIASPNRVSRRRTIKTSARGVTRDEKVRYGGTLLGDASTNT